MSAFAPQPDSTRSHSGYSQVNPSHASQRDQFGQPVEVRSSTASNQSGQQFVQTCPLRLPVPGSCPFGSICHSCPARVQAKLTVSQPGNEYEQEADRVADQVMRMPEPCQSCGENEKLQTKPLADQITPLVQRQEKPEEKEDEPVQTKQDNRKSPQVTPALETQIHSMRGGGQPLPQSARDFFELRFGTDLGHVRVHNDEHAQNTARAINARAYTHGHSVVFAAGQYMPGTVDGSQLLAHELVHVIQQQQPQSTIHRQPAAPAPLVNLTPDQVQEALRYNEDRFADPYSIRVIRDVLGLAPGTVDEALIQSVVAWQAAHGISQDGQIGHGTTRSIVRSLIAGGRHLDAIFLIIDSYRLPVNRSLYDIQVANGARCCGNTGNADATTYGGVCPPVGGRVRVCFCRARLAGIGYDHLVRIVAHELVHVPHCAGAALDLHATEFEAYYWEACGGGRAPRLSAAQRVAHANVALAHFAQLSPAAQTPARVAMRNRLNALVAAGGVGPCI